MTSKVRNARLQLAENVLNELSPMLLRRARNKAMGIARAEKDISGGMALNSKLAAERFAKGDDAANAQRMTNKGVADEYEKYEKKARQAMNLNRGMIKRRKQLKGIANAPDKPKKPEKKVDDLAPTHDDVMRAKSPFERGSGRRMNYGRSPVDPESEN